MHFSEGPPRADIREMWRSETWPDLRAKSDFNAKFALCLHLMCDALMCLHIVYGHES